jgi:hypothetical protein
MPGCREGNAAQKELKIPVRDLPFKRNRAHKNTLQLVEIDVSPWTRHFQAMEREKNPHDSLPYKATGKKCVSCALFVRIVQQEVPGILFSREKTPIDGKACSIKPNF